MARIIGKPKSCLRDHALKTKQVATQQPPVVIMSGCRWTATGGGQRPVQIARCLRRLGRDVIYVSQLDRPSTSEEGVIVTNVSDWKQLLPQMMRMSSLAICAFPSLYDYVMPLRDWCRVFDLLDDWSEFRAAGLLSADMWAERQQRIATLDSNVVTCSAKSLCDLAEAHGADPRHVKLLPNAGPEKPLPQGPAPNLLRGTVTAVFCGCLWGTWIDWQAMHNIAAALKRVGGTLNVIGGTESAAARPDMPQGDHIRYHGTLMYEEAMRYVAACDVGVIPFQGAGICKAVDPVKYYDYIAAGLPVVATDVMQELAGRPYVTLTRPDRIGAAVVEQGRRGRLPEVYVTDFCRRQSWMQRAQALLECPKLPGIWF